MTALEIYQFYWTRECVSTLDARRQLTNGLQLYTRTCSRIASRLHLSIFIFPIFFFCFFFQGSVLFNRFSFFFQRFNEWSLHDFYSLFFLPFLFFSFLCFLFWRLVSLDSQVASWSHRLLWKEIFQSFISGIILHLILLNFSVTFDVL